MEIYVLNNDPNDKKTRYRPEFVLTEFYNLVWNERFNSDGDFVLEAPITKKTLEYLDRERWISHSKTREVMIIETKNIKLDEESQNYVLRVEGKQANVFFKGRVHAFFRTRTTKVGTTITNTTIVLPGNSKYYSEFNDPETDGKFELVETPTPITETNQPPSKIIENVLSNIVWGKYINNGFTKTFDPKSNDLLNNVFTYGSFISEPEPMVSYDVPQNTIYKIMYDLVELGNIGIRVLRPDDKSHSDFSEGIWEAAKAWAADVGWKDDPILLPDLPTNIYDWITPGFTNPYNDVKWDVIWPEHPDPESETAHSQYKQLARLIINSRILHRIEGLSNRYLLHISSPKDNETIVFDTRSGDLETPEYFWAETPGNAVLASGTLSSTIVDKAPTETRWDKRKTFYSVNSDSDYSVTPGSRVPTWWEFVQNYRQNNPPKYHTVRTGSGLMSTTWTWWDLNWAEPGVYILTSTEWNKAKASYGKAPLDQPLFLYDYAGVPLPKPWMTNSSYPLGSYNNSFNLRTKLRLLTAWTRLYGHTDPTPGPSDGPLDSSYEGDIEGLRGLISYGEAVINNQLQGAMISGKLENNFRYEYKKDYGIGDIVKVLGDYDVSAEMIINEYILTVSNDGIHGYPTLGQRKRF